MTEARRSVPSRNVNVAVTGPGACEMPYTDASPSSHMLSVSFARTLTLEHMPNGQPTPSSVTVRTVPSDSVSLALRDDRCPSMLRGTIFTALAPPATHNIPSTATHIPKESIFISHALSPI